MQDRGLGFAVGEGTLRRMLRPRALRWGLAAVGYVTVVTVALWVTGESVASGLVVALLALVDVAIGVGVVVGLIVGGRRILRRPPRRLRAAAAATVLLCMAAAFPVQTEWDEQGGKASGFVPAAQATAMPVWPRSAWNGERARSPAVGYTYTCCS